MEYKGIKIYASAKSYSLWSIDEDGRLDELEHEYEGHDLVAYTFGTDGTSNDDWEYDTIEDCKKKIDELLGEDAKSTT